MGRPTLYSHPKFTRLSMRLGSRALAAGVLELVWNVAYQSGNPNVGSAEEVEFVADWKGEPLSLARALVDCGFLDETDETQIETKSLFVHDLGDHAPDYVASRYSREQERRRPRECLNCGVSFHGATKAATYCSDNCRLIHWRALKTETKETQTETDETKRNGAGNETETKRNATPSPSPSQRSLKTKAGASRPEDVPIPASLDSSAFREAWSQEIERRRQIKKPMTALAAKGQLALLEKMGIKRSLAAMESTLPTAWQKIVEPYPERGEKRVPPPKPEKIISNDEKLRQAEAMEIYWARGTPEEAGVIARIEKTQKERMK